MKVLHVPYTFFPAPSGGTEVYVAALCRELNARGIDNVIAAPGDAEGVQIHESVKVHRIRVSSALSVEQMQGGEPDWQAAQGFGRVLDETRPDVVHFHSFSSAIGNECLRQVQERGIPAIYTYHTPTATCARGTLMRWGREACDGRLHALRCGACQLHAIGLPKLVSLAATVLSPMTKTLSRALPERVRWQLPVRVLPLMQARHQNVKDWLVGMAAVVALNHWSLPLLKACGVSPRRLHLIRHGLASAVVPGVEEAPRTTGPVRLAFLGRLDPAKGIALILQALGQLPTADITLDLYLVGDQTSAFARQMLALLARDSRVRVLAPLQPVDVVVALRAYDALLVPSQVKETGPLVVLEAFAAGIPVIGSELGGIAEWVQHEVNGLLVEPGSSRAWSMALQRLADRDNGLLERLRQGVHPPRSFAEVASEMRGIYDHVLAGD